MNPAADATYIAFEGDRRIGSGSLQRRCPRRAGGARSAAGRIDPDLRWRIQRAGRDRLSRLGRRRAGATSVGAGCRLRTKYRAAAPRGPGRPKLGVVAREITLLPRHWDWLAQQKGGASVAIRKLVDEARRVNEDGDRIRLAQEAAYRFMSAMAGNRPHYEEAIRALFAADSASFRKIDRRMARGRPRPRRQSWRSGHFQREI